ncbi:hypothetical protein PENSUB_13091 [Penicillium subrubescens]|uniref:Uncharacterized protein n=1 Tax=Penicillium subrubescens TaxID=1316194 RepID=A0A1Q5SU02_9EURO|nr:hypothetical protein PENSUB_13091 [Penicillium subrubescens]
MSSFKSDQARFTAYTANHRRASVEISRLMQLVWRRIRTEDAAIIPCIVYLNDSV